jgi:hypothetical protein
MSNQKEQKGESGSNLCRLRWNSGPRVDTRLGAGERVLVFDACSRRFGLDRTIVAAYVNRLPRNATAIRRASNCRRSSDPPDRHETRRPVNEHHEEEQGAWSGEESHPSRRYHESRVLLRIIASASFKQERQTLLSGRFGQSGELKLGSSVPFCSEPFHYYA